MPFILVSLLCIGLYVVYKIWAIYTKNADGKLSVSSLSNETWALLHSHDKLGRYLPYHLYDQHSGIFHNNNQTYGVVMAISPRQYAGKQTADGFVEILSKMPDSMKLQVMMVGSRNDSGMVDAWERMRYQRSTMGGYASEGVKTIVHTAIRTMADFYRKKFNEPVSNQMSTCLKDFKIYFSFVSESLEEAKTFRKILRDVLEGNRFYPVPMNADTLKMLLWELFNANHPLHEAPEYDEHKELNAQVIAHDTTIEFTDDGCQMDGRHWVNLSPIRYPEYATISDMGMKIGDYISSAMNTNQFKDNFIITLSYARQNKHQLARVKRNHGVILTQSWSKTLFRKFNDVQKESISILDRIDVKKQSLFYVDMNVLVSGKDLKSAQLNAQIIASYWNKGGQTSAIVLGETKGIHQLCFLASLPMGISDAYLETTGKYRSMFSEQASQFVPLECDWKGNGSAHLLLASRRGQLAAIDLFISNNNYNGYVIAESGSGKSVFLIMMAFLAFTRNDRVFVLDYGGSYQRVCQIVGGQYIEPDRQNPFSLNPFSTILTMEQLKNELDFLATFVYSLGASKNKEQYEKDEKFFKSHILEVIKEGYMDFGTRLEITELKDVLEARGRVNNAQQIIDFCQQLSMFCRGGIYEEFFTGPCDVDFKNQFIVAEVQKIEGEQDLRDAIIMMLTYHQSNAIFKKEGTSSQKSLSIYDEAHKYIGKDARMDDFIEQLYRRGRKEENSTIIATQGFEDIYDSGSGMLSRAGKAIINSSSWKFFLKQSETSINLLLKAGVFSLNPMEEELMRTAKTVLGEYSEIFVITPEEYKYVYRLTLDAYFYYMTSTKKSDKSRFNQKIEEGYSFDEAIKIMIEEDAKRSVV